MKVVKKICVPCIFFFMLLSIHFVIISAAEMENNNRDIENMNQEYDILSDQELDELEVDAKSTIYEDGHPITVTIIKEATCTEDGEKEITCPCGIKNRIEIIPATGHNIVDGKCINCGLVCQNITTTPLVYRPTSDDTYRMNKDSLWYKMGYRAATIKQTRKLSSSNHYYYDLEGVTVVDPQGNIVTSLDIPSTVTIDGVIYEITKLGAQSFMHWDDLSSVTIPSSVTEIGSSAFGSCLGLHEITIPDTVTKMGDGTFHGLCFYGCTNLEKVKLPSNLDIIDFEMFMYCESLKSIGPVGSGASIEIPDTVTSISSNAFFGCKNLTRVDLPDSVTEIGDAAFVYCSSLKDVTLGNGVTRLRSKAFSKCTSLKNIKLPDSLTIVDSAVFYYCTSLESVYIPASVTTINVATSNNSPFRMCSPTLKIYCGASERKPEWGTYWNYCGGSPLQTTYSINREEYEKIINE